MADEKRNLIEDMLMLRVKWQADSEYPPKIQAAWLEAVERAIAAEENQRLLMTAMEQIMDVSVKGARDSEKILEIAEQAICRVRST